MNALELADRAYVIDRGRVALSGRADMVLAKILKCAKHISVSCLGAAVHDYHTRVRCPAAIASSRAIPIFGRSGGVAAAIGYSGSGFAGPFPLSGDFRWLKQSEAADRPLTAFCACELRSPAPFTERVSAPSTKCMWERLEWRIFDGADQSGGAQQCLPGDQSAGGTFAVCILVHRCI